MRLADVERLAAAGESEEVEFKKSTSQLRRAAETLCGFLNGTGGVVLIGVGPDGRVTGQTVADSTLREVAGLLDRFEPAVPVHVHRVPAGKGAEVLVLEAPAAYDARPFAFDGRPYQRVGTATSVMPQERYQALLFERAHARQRWENEVATGVEIDDLDQEEILRTVRLGIEAGRLPESTGKDIGDILDRLQLRKDGQLLNAAVVLFGTRLEQDYPQCQLRLARFRGIDKSAFVDNRQTHGHAFRLLDEAMAFMLRHLPISGRFEPGRLERIDEPLFPVAALREAVINAICHRTYAHAGGAVSVAIYDDRLEIWSDGTLPFGLKPEDLKRKHDSRPRNPLIAGVFYRRGLIEQWGRGTQEIVALCVRAGHPEPEFGEQAGSVWVRFLPSGYIAPHRVAHDLTERQREILQVLAHRGSLTFADVREHLSDPPSDRSIRNDLMHLRQLGLARLDGRGRGARWSLVEVTGE
ncbi:MAG: ATP-binding protein [Gemmatimonadota bacterium]